jgi:hypothetical protein
MADADRLTSSADAAVRVGILAGEAARSYVYEVLKYWHNS